MKNMSRVQSFFLELAVVVLFFSLAAAIDVRLFAAGHTLSRQSRERNAAVLMAQSIAETIRAGADAPEEIYYDENWKQSGTPAAYRAEIGSESENTAAGELVRYRIAICLEEGEELYVLNLTDYNREEDPA